MSVVSVGCCRVDVTAISRSLFQRSPAECGVSVRDLETSTNRRPKRAVAPKRKKPLLVPIFYVSLI